MDSNLYYHRQIEKKLHAALDQFPALALTGARQSGKSTLLRHTFPQFTFINLDDPQMQILARQDPRLFLSAYERPIIIDEIQYVPELLNYVKIYIDQDRRNYGQFLLTGSQMFSLMAGVSESLAGRIAIFHLYPFTIKEIVDHDSVDFGDESTLIEYVLRGFYPEHYSNVNLDRQTWFASYLSTYIERDVRNIKKVTDLGQFQIFVQLLAVRAGSILNISDLARDCGISVPTAKSWLSLLESTYIIYTLRPYYQNIGKRLVKSPKIYFIDTGLLCYLLGIDSAARFMKATERGRVFENFVIMELLKQFNAIDPRIQLFYYRTRNGVEVDLVIERPPKKIAVEIKLSKTPRLSMASSLGRFAKEFPVSQSFLLNLFEDKLLFGKNIISCHWHEGIKLILQELEKID